ncbi:hypothetical protein GUITHDRAFT_118286 [Guillardia theta CCMP2712]|uniref:U2A'/phosphoprotein 32 family A C-terminal domain-containing protein n=1 Tax=Guillardia theta (strain CCMP2712) TaxID=905079 RepID=L1IH69_GUITC|nr:hypothetical protein GUITHDRAFT_118286 [Guillardia theta CCMP2712]EKX35583.1 hypothetical protein GUITHDRAFT_118286 [Guillardia theta CCMP2712]|eukprot:XP_005822563.1 hypothetical protein GUITHDRAFT_118286 [Guillardia theta CCMP2712]
MATKEALEVRAMEGGEGEEGGGGGGEERRQRRRRHHSSGKKATDEEVLKSLSKRERAEYRREKFLVSSGWVTAVASSASSLVSMKRKPPDAKIQEEPRREESSGPAGAQLREIEILRQPPPDQSNASPSSQLPHGWAAVQLPEYVASNIKADEVPEASGHSNGISPLSIRQLKEWCERMEQFITSDSIRVKPQGAESTSTGTADATIKDTKTSTAPSYLNKSLTTAKPPSSKSMFTSKSLTPTLSWTMKTAQRQQAGRKETTSLNPSAEVEKPKPRAMSRSNSQTSTTSGERAMDVTRRRSEDPAEEVYLGFLFSCENPKKGKSLTKESLVFGRVFSLQNRMINSLHHIHLCADALVELYLEGNRITSMRGLGKMPHLELLSLKSNSICSFAGVEKQPKLKFVALEGNPVSALKLYRPMCALVFSPMRLGELHIDQRRVSRAEIYCPYFLGQTDDFLTAVKAGGLVLENADEYFKVMGRKPDLLCEWKRFLSLYLPVCRQAGFKPSDFPSSLQRLAEQEEQDKKDKAGLPSTQVESGREEAETSAGEKVEEPGVSESPASEPQAGLEQELKNAPDEASIEALTESASSALHLDCSRDQEGGFTLRSHLCMGSLDVSPLAGGEGGGGPRELFSQVRASFETSGDGVDISRQEEAEEIQGAGKEQQQLWMEAEGEREEVAREQEKIYMDGSEEPTCSYETEGESSPDIPSRSEQFSLPAGIPSSAILAASVSTPPSAVQDQHRTSGRMLELHKQEISSPPLSSFSPFSLSFASYARSPLARGQAKLPSISPLSLVKERIAKEDNELSMDTKRDAKEDDEEDKVEAEREVEEDGDWEDGEEDGDREEGEEEQEGREGRSRLVRPPQGRESDVDVLVSSLKSHLATSSFSSGEEALHSIQTLLNKLELNSSNESWQHADQNMPTLQWRDSAEAHRPAKGAAATAAAAAAAAAGSPKDFGIGLKIDLRAPFTVLSVQGVLLEEGGMPRKDVVLAGKSLISLLLQLLLYFHFAQLRLACLQDMSVKEVSELITGPPGTLVQLHLRRPNSGVVGNFAVKLRRHFLVKRQGQEEEGRKGM